MKNIETHFCSTDWKLIQPEVTVSTGSRWYQRGTVTQSFYDIKQIESLSALATAMVELNGFFSLVKCQSNQLLAAVDHIRSIPLFYGQKDNFFYLSDEAEWVRQRVGDVEMDPLFKDEFQLAGYVTGSDTLYPNVKQLQAGECLAVTADSCGRLLLEKRRYYRFVHTEPEAYDVKELETRLDKAAVRSIQNLIDYANGRQIVVPLSGGYDSRLIVALLRRAGYKNVVCYSYGVAGNSEAEYSKKIACSLGYDWLFADYENESWVLEWGTKEAEAFRQYASNHASLPHIQDWLAIKKLLRDDLIERDSVIVPGHCCVTGYIPEAVMDSRFKKKQYFETIVKTHFSGRPIKQGEALSYNVLMARVLSADADFSNRSQVASMIMEFNWAERQAKYIANSVRAYEQFGLDWWLPLWDKDFVCVWGDFPLWLRLGRKFYKSYVTNVYNSSALKRDAGISGNAGDKSAVYKIAKSAVRGLMPDLIGQYLLRKKRLREYRNHFLGFDGLLRPDELNEYVSSGYTIIGAYSSLFVEGRWGQLIPEKTLSQEPRRGGLL